MGSTAEETPIEDGHEITVLVTGFGPFRAQNPINPSWEIARQLPPFLSPPPSSTLPSAIPHPTIKILIHPSPIRVSYTTVRDLVPTLWSNQKIDYMIHIGMASGRKFYSIERRGHRDGYYMRDVDNCYLNDEARHLREGKDWVWEGLPGEILSDVEVDDVWRRWRVNLMGKEEGVGGEGMGGEGKEADVRVSEDAGRYLCDFIYYSSLAELERRGEEKRVLFLHVPVEADEVSVRKGVEITTELIRAVVASGLMKKVKMEAKAGEVGSEGLR